MMTNALSLLLECRSGLPAIVLRVTVLLAIAWIVELAARRWNPRWRVLLWRATADGVVVIAIVSCLSPPITWRVLPSAPTLATAAPSVPNLVAQPTESQRSPGESAAFVATATQPLTPPRPSISAPTVAPQNNAATAPSPSQRPAVTSGSVWSVLIVLWIVGTVALLARFAIGWRQVRRIAQQAQPAPAAVLSVAKDIATECGVAGAFDLRQTNAAVAPCTAGLVRPVVLLPSKMCRDGSGVELRGAVAHEVAHLAGKDLVWNALLEIVAAVCWFHPLAWRMRLAHADACDERCDAVATSVTNDVDGYAQLLARVALEVAGRTPTSALPMARTPHVLRRIHLLPQRQGRTRLSRGRAVAAGLLFTLASVGIGATALDRQASAAPPTSKVAEARSSDTPPVARRGLADIDFNRLTTKTVRVVTADGAPTPGAILRVVSWRDEQGDYSFNSSQTPLTTDERGEVVISAPFGAAKASFHVEAKGFASHRSELSLSGEPVVRLQPGRLVRVLAVGPDGKPLKDAVPLVEDCRHSEEFKAVPEQVGLYESPVIALDRRWMRVVAADGGDGLLFSELFDLEDPTIVDDEGHVVAKLQPGVRLRGKLDDSVPRPVKIGCVELYIQQGEGMRIVDRDGWSWRDTTPIREDGSFEFPSLPPGGQVQLFVLAEGYQSRRPTADELRQHLERHDAGDAAQVASAMARPFVPLLFPLPAGGEELEVTIDCVPTGAADVRVVDPLGRPVEGATVGFNPNCFFLGWDMVLPAYGHQSLGPLRTAESAQRFTALQPVKEWALKSFYRVVTNADGIAKVRNLPADQRLSCKVVADGFVMPIEPGSSPDWDARYALMETRGGETLRRTITMERLITRSSRALAVVHRDGKPVPGVTVTGSEIAFRGAAEDWQFWSVQRFGEAPAGTSDESGQLRFEVPRSIDGKEVDSLRVIVAGRVGGNAFVQRQRVVIPAEDDGGVIVLTESEEEPQRPGGSRDFNAAYGLLADLTAVSQLALLKELEQAPSLLVLKRLLAAAAFDDAVPLSLKEDRNLLVRFSGVPSPISRVQTKQGERVVVLCQVRPKGALWDVKPNMQFPPEAAFIFDGVNGELIKMIGGWVSSKEDYCTATLTELGVAGDYFIETSAFETNGPFEYREHWTRLGDEDKPMLTVLGYANASGWSGGSQMGPLGAEYGYTAYSFNSRRIDDSLPGVQPNGVAAPRKVYWDSQAQTFVGPAEMSFEGVPLYRVLQEQSAAFKPFERVEGAIFAAGGRDRFDNWHIWDVVVPEGERVQFRLSLVKRTDDGEETLQSQEWPLKAGMSLLQIHVNQDEDDAKTGFELRLGDLKTEASFDAPTIDFTSRDSAPGQPIVRQDKRSVVLMDYPTTEKGVRWVATVAKK